LFSDAEQPGIRTRFAEAESDLPLDRLNGHVHCFLSLAGSGPGAARGLNPAFPQGRYGSCAFHGPECDLREDTI